MAPRIPGWMAGTLGWWRADLGFLPSQWNDQSGNKRHLLQASAGAQPAQTASDSGYNNQATISFATSRYMAAASWAPPLSQPCTWYIVGETGASRADYRTFIDGSDASNRQAIFGQVTTGLMSAFAGAEVDLSVDGAAKHIHCIVINGASSAYYVDAFTTASASGSLGTQPINGLTVGTKYDASGLFLNGKIAELACFPGAHSLTDRGDIVRYLGGRYAVTVT